MATTPPSPPDPALLVARPLSRFAQSIAGISPVFEMLYGTHVCDLYTARSYLEYRALPVLPCDKFAGESLLYLFYGKPAYRPRSESTAMRRSSFYPVCFVATLDRSIQLKRVFPLDTGAFPERYREFFDARTKLEDLALPAKFDSARQVVEAFYKSNSDYFDSKPRDSHGANRTIETDEYHAMLRTFADGNRMPGDERLITIELQAAGQVAIDSGSIRAVVLPDKALELADVASALVACRVPFRHYRTGALLPRECHALVEEEVRKLHIEAGRISL